MTTLLYEEGKRWVETVKDKKEEKINSYGNTNINILIIIGDVFLSSALISYCGPFIGSYRIEMTQNWLK